MTGDGDNASDRPRASDPWRYLYEALGYLGGLILAIMTGTVFLQVILRYLGRMGIDGIDEVPRFLFVWLVMIGAAAAMYRGEHTSLDYFINLLGPRLRAFVSAGVSGVGIALFLYLIRLSFVLVPNGQLQTSAGLGLPLGYLFVAVPVGSALIIIPMLRNFVAALRSLWQKRS
jgi:TRAP-type C4-dicarboxylate transport system permease small subunit